MNAKLWQRNAHELMATRRSGTRCALLALVLATAWHITNGRPARSEEAPETGGTATIKELEARVEQMERQNQELLQLIEQVKAANRTDDPVRPTSHGNETGSGTFRPAALKAAQTGPAAAAGEEWYEVGSDLKMTARWNHGVEIESAHHDFKLHVGGRTQVDVSLLDAGSRVQQSLPPTARFHDGVDFRRARFTINGTLWENNEWTTEFDFVNSAASGTSAIGLAAPTDLWWQFTHVPLVGNVRVGNFKEPIGFEHLTSSRFLNFMERSFNQDAFYGGFNNGFTPGIGFFNQAYEERLTLAAGLFKPTSNAFAFSTNTGEWATTARVTALPWYVNDGRGLLHVGFSARYHNVGEGSLRYRTRASARNGLSANWPVIADTGTFLAESEQWLNAELVAILGPWQFASEFLTSWAQNAHRLTSPADRTTVTRGGYVEALYFLTGEHRAYNKKTGALERVVPVENAFLVEDEEGNRAFGRGAWQIGARYSFLDLNSAGINGGILHDTTIGLNWYLNPNAKLQWNYFYTHRESADRKGDGVIDGFGMRFAYDF
jgi:phosphate-selective porin OprO/OprP